MSLTVREQYVVHPNQLVRGGILQPQKIMIHETANTAKGANAAAHGRLQAGGWPHASWHSTADDTEIVVSYSDTAITYHSGVAAFDRTRYAIEICVNSDGNYDQARDNAAQYAAMKIREFGLEPRALEQHNAAWGKNCPAIMRKRGLWASFVDTVERYATRTSEPEPETIQEWINSMKIIRNNDSGTCYIVTGTGWQPVASINDLPALTRAYGPYENLPGAWCNTVLNYAAAAGQNFAALVAQKFETG